jgi:hypothetical protein
MADENAIPEILPPEGPEPDLFLILFPELAALAVLSRLIDELPGNQEDRHA